MPYYENEVKHYIHNIKDKIKNSIYSKLNDLFIEVYITKEPVSYEEKLSGEKKVLAPGQKWGDLWDCAWFHFKGKVPDEAKGKKVVLLIDINGEACIFDDKGCPIQGLTNVNSDFDYSLGLPGKRVVDVTDCSNGGEIIDFWADAGCNDLFGKYKGSGTIKEACIAICNEQMRQLYYDFEVLEELVYQIPADKARHHQILNALNDASNVLYNFTDNEALKARKILKNVLDKRGGDPSLTISAVGHAHIDLAWLWPLRETIRKGARTFSTALKYMDKYPEYVFGASQAQLYDWMKEKYPLLYEKIKEKVKQGRWEVQGAMWVEADTNITGGESLVRQILYGKRFFKKEFDKDMKILWLPDVFGYTGSLPQILKKSGVDYFMTIKLSWSIINQHPHHTFIWQGIDGSEILSHMPPEGTYNSSAAPRAVFGAEKYYKDKAISDKCLMLFGIGDGGGGPGEEHLERLIREKNLDGLSPVVQEPAINFFDKLNTDRKKYKKWTGELYLERHQGTYTTQARNKKYNRKIEIALRELEFASSMASLYSDYKYPKDAIDKIWKEVLLYQFHDIIPGSSITRVYNESLARYAILLEKVQNLTKEAYDCLSHYISDGNNQYIVFNSLSWERDEFIKINNKWFHITIPAVGYKMLNSSAICDDFCIDSNNDSLENNLIKITFNNDGSIKYIYDKEYSRQVLEENKSGNNLSLYEDMGDAWDIPINYSEKPGRKPQLISTEAYTDGPKAIVKHIYKIGSSTICQKVIVTHGSKRIDFETEVDWKESNKMLRTSFPVNVFTDYATCNIQFGNIKRPTHQNTTWDMAKYEICAHKWVDMSQGDYGVALLNDCKYGHSVYGNTIDLNLLRSTNYPDPQADRANHTFTYSLYPHNGDYVSGNVNKEAYKLNSPVYVKTVNDNSGNIKSEKSFIEIDNNKIILETVKIAEDSDDIIIRLYESAGSGQNSKIKFNIPVKQVHEVNLMEEEEIIIDMNDNTIDISFKPFEIKTLKLAK